MSRGKPLTPERAWEYLLWLLSRRAYTVAELRQRLLRRGLLEEEAEPLLVRLEELQLVDDALYTEQYVRSRKGERGKLALRRELRRKGVHEELIAGELDALEPPQQLLAAAELLRKHAWRYQPKLPGEESILADHEVRTELLKARAKAFAFLARRGFSAGIAASALEEVGWFGDE